MQNFQKKKNTLAGIILCFVAVFIASGCGKKQETKKIDNSTDQIEVEKQEQEDVGSAKTTKEEQEDNSTVVTTTLKKLLNQGKSQKCEYARIQSDGSKITLAAYISGDQYRTAFNISGGKNSTSTMYGTEVDGYKYLWSDDSNIGSKYKSDIVESEKQEFFDELEEQNFKCAAWKYDSSMFKLPEDVEFIDDGVKKEKDQEKLKEIDQDLDDMKVLMCKNCEKETGQAEKDKCVKMYCE